MKEGGKEHFSKQIHLVYSYFFLLDPEARVLRRKGEAFFLL